VGTRDSYAGCRAVDDDASPSSSALGLPSTMAALPAPRVSSRTSQQGARSVGSDGRWSNCRQCTGEPELISHGARQRTVHLVCFGRFTLTPEGVADRLALRTAPAQPAQRRPESPALRTAPDPPATPRRLVTDAASSLGAAPSQPCRHRRPLQAAHVSATLKARVGRRARSGG
jgi:hypothetical protein